jgi:hypothetical protein
MADLTPGDIPIRDADAMFAMLDDSDGVVLHVGNKTYYSLNETAVAILQACTGEKSLAQIAEDLTASYEVGPDEALAEVFELVQTLLDEGLVRLSTPSPR